MVCIERVCVRSAALCLGLTLSTCVIGCQSDFRRLRLEGQRAMLEGRYAVAQDRFQRAHRIWPGDAENLYDLGTVAKVYAKRQLADGNHPAALRELDRAIDYFTRTIEAHPGMQAAWRSKNEALELKGQADEALRQAEWAMRFVGPSARQQLFLAGELEERGDLDGALLCYRQAVAMEPDNAHAHAAFGEFLITIDNNEMAVVHLNRAYILNPLEPGVAMLLTDLGAPLPRTTAPYEP